MLHVGGFATGKGWLSLDMLDGIIEINHPPGGGDAVKRFDIQAQDSLLLFCICGYMQPGYSKEHHRGTYPLVQNER